MNINAKLLWIGADPCRVLYHADKPGEKDPGEGKTVSETSFVHPQKVGPSLLVSAFIASRLLRATHDEMYQTECA